jgi:hypothetical protein
MKCNYNLPIHNLSYCTLINESYLQYRHGFAHVLNQVLSNFKVTIDQVKILKKINEPDIDYIEIKGVIVGRIETTMTNESVKIKYIP